jgi:hypothetical protein
MTQIHWTSPVSADFGTAADWSGGKVPGAGDDAILDATGSPFTVTSNVDETVGSIRTASNATLDIAGGDFTASAGTGAGVNAGRIIVGPGAALSFGGTLENTGSIELVTSIGHNLQLNMAGPLINQAGGVIDASGGASGVVTTTQPITNDGVLESTGAGTLLEFDNATINGSGQIFAGAGASVRLGNSTVIGGVLNTAAGGRIDIATLEEEAHASFTGGGSFTNAGTIALDGVGASLILDEASALTGGGTVQLNGEIKGTTRSVVLTNVDNTMAGAGLLGGGALTLINEAAGVIDADNSVALTIDTGTSIITNAGLIEAAGAGGNGVIDSAVRNTGTLAAAGGTLTVNGAVTGAGSATINGGTLDFTSKFNENVKFTGQGGQLVLADSQAYTRKISGFSLTGKTSLDLGDIGFVSSTEATFSGTTRSGVLTVTDGTHTAKINLVGDYLGSTFTAAGDGHGGTIVVDRPSAGRPVADPAAATPTALAPVHQFVTAMAALGAGSAGAMHAAADAWRAPASMLTAPRMHMA